MPGEAIRAFVALPAPAPVREAIGEALERVRGRGGGGVRWVDPAGAHLTLRFLGSSDRPRLERLEGGLRSVAVASPPVDLEVDRPGAFPGWGRPRVLWLGLVEDPALVDLAAAVETAAREAGFPPEGRAFRPHVTVGRVRDDRAARGAVARLRNWRPDPVVARVEEVVLYRSDPGPDGPRYTALERYRLGGDR